MKRQNDLEPYRPYDSIYFEFDWPQDMRKRTAQLDYGEIRWAPLTARVRARHKCKAPMRVHLVLSEDGKASRPLMGWIPGTGKWELVELQPNEDGE